MARFEILDSELQKLVKVTLEGDSVRAEAGALHYYRGEIEMKTERPKASSMFSSLASGQSIFRPEYKGYGEIFFGPPVFGEYVMLELNGETWVLERGSYVCSSADIVVSAVRNKGAAAVLGGEGLYQTSVSGTGTVVAFAPGRVQRVDLDNDRLAVDGTFAVARTGDVRFSVQKAAASILGSVASGEGLLSVYEGTGIVLLAPVSNLYQAVSDLTGDLGPTSATAAGNGASIMRVVGVFAALGLILLYVLFTIIMPAIF